MFTDVVKIVWSPPFGLPGCKVFKWRYVDTHPWIWGITRESVFLLQFIDWNTLLLCKASVTQHTRSQFLDSEEGRLIVTIHLTKWGKIWRLKWPSRLKYCITTNFYTVIINRWVQKESALFSCYWVSTFSFSFPASGHCGHLIVRVFSLKAGF